MLDFLQHQIAPLMQSPHPAWQYSGPDDEMRLECGDQLSVSESTLKRIMKLLTGHEDLVSGTFLVEIVALADDARIRASVLESQPRYDTLRLVLVEGYRRVWTRRRQGGSRRPNSSSSPSSGDVILPRMLEVKQVVSFGMLRPREAPQGRGHHGLPQQPRRLQGAQESLHENVHRLPMISP